MRLSKNKFDQRYFRLLLKAGQHLKSLPKIWKAYQGKKPCLRTFQYDVAALLKKREPFVLPKDNHPVIITAAQNETDVDLGFWATLNNISNRLKAHIVVVPILYNDYFHSSASKKTKRVDFDAKSSLLFSFHTIFQDYLCTSRLKIAPGITLLGDLQQIATTPNPLSKLEEFQSPDHLIVGAYSQQLRTIIRVQPPNSLAMSTGAVTFPNFIDKKSGYFAQESALPGAIIVTRNWDTNQGYARFLSSRKGVVKKQKVIYDLNFNLFNKKVLNRPLALILGDLHLPEETDPHAWNIAIDQVKTLKPQHVICHDALNNDILYKFSDTEEARDKMALENNGSIRNNMVKAFTKLEELSSLSTSLIFPVSNHDDRIRKWLYNSINIHIRRDNKLLWHELWVAQMKNPKENPMKLAWAICMGKVPENVRFLDRREPFILGAKCDLRPDGIRLDIHGHGFGESPANLGRGSGTYVKGHTHQPLFKKGVFNVGTNTYIPIGYAAGFCGWLGLNALLYSNGAITPLMFDDKGWTC